MRRNRRTSTDQETPQEKSTCSAETDSSSAPESRAEEPRDLGALARRIASLSGNLLATAVIVILGLTFGRQVLTWWRGEPAVVSVPTSDHDSALDGLADPSLPHQLAFSDMSLTFNRSLFEGAEEAALARLRDECRRLELDFDDQPRALIPVDDDVLRRLAAYESVERGEGWRMVQHGGPVITVVALRTAPNTASTGAGEASQKAESVVSWGLGLRAPETATEEAASTIRWILFTCSGAGQRVASDLNLSSPIPPGSRRTLAMQVKGGGALIGFAGQGTAASSKEFFDQSFQERGWSRVRVWTRIGNHWHARFQEPEAGTCDVQIRDDTDRGTSGIMTMRPAAQNSEN
jgi:hypothetical protein